MAVSVLPTPLGPTSRKTPIGRRGSVRFARDGADPLGDRLQGVRLADDPLFHALLERQDGADLVGHHPADRDAGPAGDHLGDRLRVDADLHQRVLALKRLELAGQLGQLLARAARAPRARAARRRRGGGRGWRGRRLGASAAPACAARPAPAPRRRGGRFQPAADLADLADQLATPLSSGLPEPASSASASLLASRQFVEPLPMVGAGAVLAVEDARSPRVKLLDAAAAVLDGRRGGRVADGHPGAGRVEQADRLVGQLPAGNVAVREPHGVDHGLVEDAHLVVLLQRRDQAAHHVHAGGFGRLLDLDDLEAAGQGGVLLEVLLVLGPGRGGDRAQLAAGQGRLEQIGGVALPGLPAGADHRVRLVDEEDDRLRRGLHLVDHRLQAVLELALDAGPGLQQAEVERAERRRSAAAAARRRRRSAGRSPRPRPSCRRPPRRSGSDCSGGGG